ncbi:hypothetical protein SAMN04487898_103120 [Pedobacter sp. ok626]|uniref:hypothetical protein n=1 Tax=Pedobacter sp. ok626 TaxID=1761882 RepID=UPI00087DFD37|nr:hypothetical protein [Pedobacter sp. ok626]SDJ51029.1 hypothetical protein SAMN04487898_103120 [Pedobacter sp. ok626]
MTANTTELTVVQFKKHKVAYTVAAVVSLLLGGMLYFVFKDDGSVSLAWFFLAAGILLSAYCTWNTFSNAVVLELNPEGIKYKQYFYSWNRLRSYAIRKEEDEGGTFNYLVLNLKNAKVPLEIQLDWINDQKSVTENMAIFTKAFQIEFEGVLK